MILTDERFKKTKLICNENYERMRGMQMEVAGFLDFFTSINKGFKGGITIIAFLFMVGGSLNILPKTGAIVAGLSALVKKIRNHSILLIPVLMTTLISRQYNEFIKEVRC